MNAFILMLIVSLLQGTGIEVEPPPSGKLLESQSLTVNGKEVAAALFDIALVVTGEIISIGGLLGGDMDHALKVV